MPSYSRDRIPASDDEIATAFSKLGYGISADPECGDDLSYGPAAEIDEFRTARRAWHNPGKVITHTPDALEIIGAQTRKGQRRRDVVLIRFGEYCAIYGMDK